MKKKVLVQAYTHQNLGDDLFLKILFERYPDVDFTLIADEKTYREIFDHKNVSFLSYAKSILDNKIVAKIAGKISKIRFLAMKYKIQRSYLQSIQHQFDATVTIGGSIFMEKKDKRMNKLSIHTLLADVFKIQPKFIISSNFGPFKQDLFYDYYSTLFNSYTDVCFRDSYSHALFNKVNVRCCPDAVFSFSYEAGIKIPKTVGFSIMDFKHRDILSMNDFNYKNSIAKLVVKYIEDGITPYLFSFCSYEGDERAIEEIINLLPEEQKTSVKKVFYRGNIESFIDIFSKMEVMFATRFHALVLGILFEQKVYPIIYSEKTLNILEDMHYNGSYSYVSELKEEMLSKINPQKFNLPHDIKIKAGDQFSALHHFVYS